MKRLTTVCLLITSFVFVESASAQLFGRLLRPRTWIVWRCPQPCPQDCPQASAAPELAERSSTPKTDTTSSADASDPSMNTVDLTSISESNTLDSGKQASDQSKPKSEATIIDQESIPSPSDLLAAQNAVGPDAKKWKSLFDGKKLGDWVSTKFGGEGDVVVENGQITCDFGQYITGITYKGKDLPTNNYEIELEAQRVDGSDFFCGLTFPVDDKHATFVVGGWGGSVTGISSIDSYDASENDTTDYMEFKNKRWYKIRVRVTPGVLEAWIDKKKMVSKEIESDRLSTRIEVDPSKPLGICCFDTQAAYRNIRIRTENKPDMVPEE